MTQRKKDWQTLASKAKDANLLELFAQDEHRVEKLTLGVDKLEFDFSKTHLTDELLEAFDQFFESQDFETAKQGLFAGEILNPSEGRPVLHTALRGSFAPEKAADGSVVAPFIQAELSKMRQFVDQIHTEQKYDHVLHLGIGGSALGPQMVVEALQHLGPKMDVHVVSNVDGAALAGLLPKLNASRTLVIVASKTFTTIETLTNARTALDWLASEGVENPMGAVVAATANPQAAKDFGVQDEQIFAFADWVGGRYSLWSTIGLPIALGLGNDVFGALLSGASQMDTHFKTSSFQENAPMIAAALDVFYASFLGAETRAAFAYDERLKLLVPYLQQLEMESNGKRVDAKGAALDYPSGPITWGGVGTDAQHAVFQLLHQGTHLIPTEFIAVLKPDHEWETHHQQLLANCFGQSAALMQGQDNSDKAKEFPGNKPSTTILLDRLTAQALGALLAFYEHRTFTAGFLWGVNSFDQMGVELGKQLAKTLTAILAGEQSADDLDPSTQALLARII
ncbi:MAG: glucose-6-phosphate isomerase [Sphingomonadales bacterium]